jgi:hypothetical protein
MSSAGPSVTGRNPLGGASVPDLGLSNDSVPRPMCSPARKPAEDDLPQDDDWTQTAGSDRLCPFTTQFRTLVSHVTPVAKPIASEFVVTRRGGTRNAINQVSGAQCLPHSNHEKRLI